MENIVNELVALETTPAGKPDVSTFEDAFFGKGKSVCIQVTGDLLYFVHENATVDVWDDKSLTVLGTFTNSKDAYEFMCDARIPW